jgi:hypothetical protein
VEPNYRSALGRFLAATPLTDIGSIDRREPSFAWTGATLGLIQSVEGRTLAERTVRARKDLAAAAREAARAAGALGVTDAETDPAALLARELADGFARTLAGYAANRGYAAGSSRRAG